MPQSRRHPHFSRQALARSLETAGIGYRHFESLGGLREPATDSPHAALRNPAFRGYADHMGTPEFTQALEELMALARGGRLAVMCAEANPRDCHRLLLSDALVARGWTVEHILDAHPGAQRHCLSPHAHVSGDHVSYPDRQRGLGLRNDTGGAGS
jgi:uncharacterized protein (DUF488 family)